MDALAGNIICYICLTLGLGLGSENFGCAIERTYHEMAASGGMDGRVIIHKFDQRALDATEAAKAGDGRRLNRRLNAAAERITQMTNYTREVLELGNAGRLVQATGVVSGDPRRRRRRPRTIPLTINLAPGLDLPGTNQFEPWIPRIGPWIPGTAQQVEMRNGIYSIYSIRFLSSNTLIAGNDAGEIMSVDIGSIESSSDAAKSPSVKFTDPRSRLNGKSDKTTDSSAHDGITFSLSTHPDNPNLFASGSEDCLLKLWDIRSPQRPTGTLYGHESDIMECEHMSNGYTIGTASDDGTCRLFDSRSCQEMNRFFHNEKEKPFQHPDPSNPIKQEFWGFNSLSFSKSGRLLFATADWIPASVVGFDTLQPPGTYPVWFHRHDMEKVGSNRVGVNSTGNALAFGVVDRFKIWR